MTNDIDQNIFEERAERLSQDELKKWTEITQLDRNILEKLKGPGVKLLLGPRGSGKSTLLKLAYFEAMESEQILPIYVNYSHSLALEPLFHSNANALMIFRQWVLLKILESLLESIKYLKIEPNEKLLASAKKSTKIIRDLEKGIVPDKFDIDLSPSELVELIEEEITLIERGRCILLLDDAAHAFSIEQQREFFEIFRQLRSRKISGKAAIYPGITSFSHNFNVGHEAEIVEAWYNPSEEYYIPLMKQIAEKRLGSELIGKLGANYEEHITLLSLAASGQPRGFLIMLSEAIGDTEKPTALSKRRVSNAIENNASYIDGVFSSLAAKLPRFKNYISTGQQLKIKLLEICNEFNKEKEFDKKVQVFGVKEPLNRNLGKILQFFEYSGTLRKLKSHSRGKIGSYQRYQFHSAVIYEGSGLGLGQTFSTNDLIKSLSNHDAREFCKTSASKLLYTEIENLSLNLPACNSCGANRQSTEQKFCMECGSRLTDASIYIELLKKPIAELPLPKKKIEGIKKYTNLKTVQDIIADESQTLLNVPHIGKVWSTRIKNMAEEYVSV